jgi:hypothetical protein
MDHRHLEEIRHHLTNATDVLMKSLLSNREFMESITATDKGLLSSQSITATDKGLLSSQSVSHNTKNYIMIFCFLVFFLEGGGVVGLLLGF